MALKVDIRISFSFPHVVPPMAFRTLFLFLTLLTNESVFALKLWSPSKMTPRIFGFLTVGTGQPSISIFSSLLISLLKVVKRVADDLPGESSISFAVKHSRRVCSYGLTLSSNSGMLGLETITVKSSA